MSSSEDEIVLSKRSRPSRPQSTVKYEEDSDDEDKPLAELTNGIKTEPEESNGKKRKKLSQLKEKSKKAKKSKKSEKSKKKDSKSKSSTESKSKSKSETKAEPIPEPNGKPVNGVSKTPEPKSENEPEEDDDKFKWWEDESYDAAGNGEKKWDSLHHNGVIFPPPYEPLPSYVKLYYDGKPVDLPLEAEEVAGFFGTMIDSDHTKNPVFQKNFFNDFLTILNDSGGANLAITEFEKLDFTKIFQHYSKLREEKKSLTRDEKKRLKEERDKLEEPFKTCLLNGRKEQVGNFRVEPPGLFRGRGAHPKTGKVKRRVLPEDITLNLSEGAKIPDPPEGHKWGEVKHDNTVVWLAMWRENIADQFKYVKFAATSSIKGLSDYRKFETARNLKNYIDAIRKDYTKLLKDPLMQQRQIATATYLIDKFALRAGGEKGDDEADTVGCCSLRYEHVTLKPPNIVIFDFLGKDSIRFYQEVEVDKQVFKNLRIFKKAPKQPGDNLFDRINPTIVNRQFQNYMKGLTAKVFRTYNASKVMQDQLDLIPNEGTVAEKVVRFNAANRTVAILCNHQRTLSKNHETSISKINDKILELNWQKNRLKKIILEIDPSEKDRDTKFFKGINLVNKTQTKKVHKIIINRMLDQNKKKYQREKEKAVMTGVTTFSEEDFNAKNESIEQLAKDYERELDTGVPAVPNNATVAKLRTQIETIENRITNTEFQLKDKEDNSEVSLGTSKMNYIDPRLTVVFAKKFDVPIEKLFTKTLREKFTWAIESVDENWRF